MADKFRVVVGQGNRRRLVNDLPFRNDLLSNRQQDYITAMVNHVNPYSPYAFFTGLFGNTQGTEDQNDPKSMFSIETSTTGAEFIRIKETIFEKRPSYVVDSSRVPAVLVAGQPFEVSLDYAIADEGEFGKLWDDKTMITVISRRNTAGRKVDFTMMLNGQPGATADGSLLSSGKPVNWGYGNTKGEGSETSNTLGLDANKSNIFYNPTVITRYMWQETGSGASDEVFRFHTERAIDGSEPQDFMVNIPVVAFKESLERIEGMIVDSVANFDPVTLEPTNMGGQNGYPELPSYAGILEQMDQAHVKYNFPAKMSPAAALSQIESIQRQIQEIWRDADIMIICRDGGKKFIEDALLYGGQQKYPMQLTREIGSDNMVDMGYGIRKFQNGDGAIMIYDLGKGYKTAGEFKTWSYKGHRGPARSRDIFFVPVRKGANGSYKKIARYFTKSGNGYNRAFVFGVMKGLTGKNGRNMSDAALQAEGIRQMMNNEANVINSVADRNEYHLMFEGVPYIDIYGLIKGTIVD